MPLPVDERAFLDSVKQPAHGECVTAADKFLGLTGMSMLDLSQAMRAEYGCCGRSTLLLWFRGRYGVGGTGSNGRNDTVWLDKRVWDFVQRHTPKATETPAPPDVLKTEGYWKVRTVFEDALESGAGAVIYGPPSAEKSELLQHLVYSRRAAGHEDAVYLYCGPELATPFPLLREPQALAEIAELTGESRVLLTGAVRIGAEAGAPRYYNSFYLFGARGAPLAAYDKFHLVPFGEYMPFAPVLYALGVREIAAATGFSAGSGPVTLPAPGAPPFTPLICYEIIFPGAVTGFPRPSWLVNITDDSWFGPNAGPMQHLLIARVRAIEEGLPVARAANAGISAIIDPYGRLRGRLDLGVRGVLDGPLPAALAATQAARFGGIIFMSLLVLTAGLAFAPGPVRRA